LDIVDGEVWEGRQDPADLGGEGRRRNEDLVGGAIRNDFPGRHDNDSLGGLRREFDIVSGQHDACSSAHQGADDFDQGPFRPVVEATGGLVEQKHSRGGRELDGEGEGEDLTFGEVARVACLGDVWREAIEQLPGGPCLPIGVAVRLRTLVSHRVEIEEVSGRLGNETDELTRLVGGQRCWIERFDCDLSSLAWAGSLQSPQQ
jgi:hypothetical protein